MTSPSNTRRVRTTLADALSRISEERLSDEEWSSGHLTDPVGEAIDLFEHMLDKTALVWFQMNRSKFKDLTTLKRCSYRDITHGERLREYSYNHGIYYHLILRRQT